MDFDIVEVLLNMTLLGTEWVLWLLILASVVSIALIMERGLYFYRIRLNFQEFNQKMTPHLIDGDIDQVKKLCEEHQSLETNVILNGLNVTEKGPEAMEESMTSYLLGQRQNFDRGLGFLGTMGNNAPFIGLFGTVLGIIQAFNDLANNPAGGPSVVMAGISEALVATAVGLLVAIPAVIAFNGYNRMVKRHFNNSESLMKVVLSHFKTS